MNNFFSFLPFRIHDKGERCGVDFQQQIDTAFLCALRGHDKWYMIQWNIVTCTTIMEISFPLWSLPGENPIEMEDGWCNKNMSRIQILKMSYCIQTLSQYTARKARLNS